ncbi:aminoglycoside phosphotransferase family protein [Caldichromatium japonicum]|uniref:Aminoglycoside phosphotransferase family protein n=1 Tax=Caldichromatium japonicum TaxID=2699430 RepID=A0A6G7VDN6_9GAMM|nr:aminoglycoside phosphotransferase family protein [Caldichromatium japonicum]QIK38020.1 aminoglycoside phosphotransferase family protein [Caldichromatium japonicum]
MPISLHHLIAQFAIEPVGTSIAPWGRGLINDTYVFAAGERRYVLQRLNDRVFPDPSRIMANLARLGAHPIPPESVGLRLPPLIYARDGLPYVRDAQGSIWRLLEFIPDTQTLERLDSPQQARSVGRLLGRFHRWASELPLDHFEIVLPGFHDTPGYLARLQAAADRLGEPRPPEIAEVLAFVAARIQRAHLLTEARRSGRIRPHLTHGDPKLDNLLFSVHSEEAIALIDLDTLQPGLIHHDLGDCLRSCCNRRGEATAETLAVRFDIELAEAILHGYAEEMRGQFGADEIALIGDGIWTLPFELGVRFLTDHLEGDRYFKVEHRGQNLERARVQFALAADIERQEDALCRAIRQAFG